MASKKKSTKKTRHPQQPQTFRGHQATHTVQELRDHGHAVLIFNQNDKRALGAGLGASLGAMVGLIVADKPKQVGEGLGRLYEYVVKYLADNKEMLEAAGVKMPPGWGGAPSTGPVVPNETILFDVWSTTAPLLSDATTWFERRDVAIWRTTADGARHAFALAFDGAIPSACGQASDTATSPLFEIRGVCGSCQSILTDHGYKPPRMGAPPPQAVDADFAPDGPSPKRRKRTRKAKTQATASE